MHIGAFFNFITLIFLPSQTSPADNLAPLSECWRLFGGQVCGLAAAVGLRAALFPLCFCVFSWCVSYSRSWYSGGQGADRTSSQLRLLAVRKRERWRLSGDLSARRTAALALLLALLAASPPPSPFIHLWCKVDQRGLVVVALAGAASRMAMR